LAAGLHRDPLGEHICAPLIDPQAAMGTYFYARGRGKKGEELQGKGKRGDRGRIVYRPIPADNVDVF